MTPQQIENDRVEFVSAIDLTGRPTDPVLQQLTEIAAQLWNAPIALVSVVDDHHQRFAAKVGMDVDCTPRSQAFCAHTIRQDDLFMIKDATQDERFANNPLVTGSPNIRFYAGAPLRVRGLKIGTLCVIDTQPRAQIDNIAIDTLLGLASVAATHIEAHHAPRQAEQHQLATIERLLDFGSWSFDSLTGESNWSARLYELMARDPSDGPMTRAELILAIHPDDRGAFLDHVNRYTQTLGAQSQVKIRVNIPESGYQVFNFAACSSPGPNPAGMLLEGVMSRG